MRVGEERATWAPLGDSYSFSDVLRALEPPTVDAGRLLTRSGDKWRSGELCRAGNSNALGCSMMLSLVCRRIGWYYCVASIAFRACVCATFLGGARFRRSLCCDLQSSALRCWMVCVLAGALQQQLGLAGDGEHHFPLASLLMTTLINIALKMPN